MSEGGETGRETERVNEQRERERKTARKEENEMTMEMRMIVCERVSERRLLLLLTFDFMLLSPSSSLIQSVSLSPDAACMCLPLNNDSVKQVPLRRRAREQQ